MAKNKGKQINFILPPDDYIQFSADVKKSSCDTQSEYVRQAILEKRDRELGIDAIVETVDRAMTQAQEIAYRAESKTQVIARLESLERKAVTKDDLAEHKKDLEELLNAAQERSNDTYKRFADSFLKLNKNIKLNLDAHKTEADLTIKNILDLILSSNNKPQQPVKNTNESRHIAPKNNETKAEELKKQQEGAN